MDTPDDWQRVTGTLDWVAAVIADFVGREPKDLVWPGIALGLAGGLLADGTAMRSGAPLATAVLALVLTLSGFGALALVAARVGRRPGGGAASAETSTFGPWLRRLQVLFAAVLVAVVVLLVYGAVVGSVLLVARNTLEVARVGGIVLAISWLLMDDDIGLPDWLASRLPATADAHSRNT